jgi:hypothetical protein
MPANFSISSISQLMSQHRAVYSQCWCINPWEGISGEMTAESLSLTFDKLKFVNVLLS